MTSPKQRAANRRNALHSTGPCSEAGRCRSAVNALRHGLTLPVESTPWGSKLPELAALLLSEGLDSVASYELARRLVDYERNIAYQRQRFLAGGLGPEPVAVPDKAQEDLAIAAQLAQLTAQNATHLIGIDDALSLEIQKIFQRSAARQIRQADEEAANMLKNADRYLRRSANQLIKLLKAIEI